MALQRDTHYPGRYSTGNATHPQGAFKNRTTPTSQDGSYLEKDWLNDWDGFFASLLNEAGITPNGDVDAVGASQYFNALKGVAAQPGALMYYAASSAPSGWLKANGAAVSRTTYAKLFAAIGTTFGTGNGSTTFNLPDLRGEFLRGYDDGRGIDVSRVFGSTQSSQNLLHEHLIFGTGSRSSHILTFESPGTNIRDAPMIKMTATVYPANDASGRGSDFIATGNGGGESRPRNMALLACIKY